MKALQDVHSPFDRIATRDELSQVIHVLLDLREQRAGAANDHQTTSDDIEADSEEVSTAFWGDASPAGVEDLAGDLQPPAQLFPGEFEFIN